MIIAGKHVIYILGQEKTCESDGLNLLCFTGARQLFWSDVHSSLTNFQAMYTFMAIDVALSSDRRQLDSLPMQSRAKLLAVTAAFVPYYNHSAVRFCLS